MVPASFDFCLANLNREASSAGTSLPPGYEPHLSVRELSWQMVFARLVTHYWGHGCFLADNEVLANMARIAHIPATLIHGLHDVSGPLDTAWELHKAWPTSRLVVVDDAGHFGGSMGEQFTAADVVIGSGLRWGMMFKGIPERPEFVAYAGRVAERPAAKRATAKDQELAAA